MHEAARAKGLPLEERPTTEPMRPAASGQIARNPSTDQKRVRRANTLRRSACRCSGCGYVGAVSGGLLGPACGACGSYRIYSVWQPSKGNTNKDECPQCGSEDLEWQHHPSGQYSAFQCQDCGRMGDDDNPFGHLSSKVATIVNTRAEALNPGDQIRNPNGRTFKVMRVRPHETSAKHVYVDTDGGTTLAERGQAFQVSPTNSQQQSLPGYGTPGGNSNHLPFDPQTSGSNQAPSTKCPNCGGHGTLARQGDHYSCSRCGYREQFGGAGGATFSDAKSVVRTFSTVNGTTQSVVARRATALLNSKESTQ